MGNCCEIGAGMASKRMQIKTLTPLVTAYGLPEGATLRANESEVPIPTGQTDSGMTKS